MYRSEAFMSKQRILSIFILIIILLTSQISFSAAENLIPLNDVELEWLENHPVIYYAPDPGFAPIEYFDPLGDANGIAIEYINWIEANYPINIELVQLKSWSDILMAIEDKEIDMITATKNPRRAEFMTFSDSYVDLDNTILVREDFNGSLTEDDLQTVQVGVMRDYAVQDYLEIKYPDIELIKFDSIEEALKKLSFGTLDALVVDVGQGSFYTTEFGITNLRSAGNVAFSYKMTFAARDDYTLLVNIMNKAIQSMPEEEKNRIRTSWISYRLENNISNQLIFAGLVSILVVLLILGAFFLWNRLLRRQVALQTEKLQTELNLRMSIQEELLTKNQQITSMNRELEMTQRELSNLINLVPYHIFAKEKNGKYVLVNESFLNFYGFTELAVIGQDDATLFSNYPTDFLDQFLIGEQEVFESHEPVMIEEIQMFDADGTPHTMRLKKIPYFIWKSKEWGMLGVTIDITDLKLAEQKLAELNEKLEAKVERRAYLLNETNRELELSMYKLQMKQSQLEDSNLLLEDSLINLRDTQNQLIESEKLAALGRLVAGVSHEINTPLGIGITTISYLEKECLDIKKNMDDQNLTRKNLTEFLNGLEDTTKLVLTNLKNAAGLVNKFKQIAVDQSTEELRQFNLLEYLDGIIQSLSPQLKHTDYSVKLTCPDDIEIRSYPSILTQIITNLVMNSIIHGFDGRTKGNMTLNVEPINEGILTIHYQDDGNGISSDHLEKIFEPFFTTKRGQGGVGLGLNIVYNLITRTLNGKIDVESEPHEGVHFKIEIPLPNKDQLFSYSNEENIYN